MAHGHDAPKGTEIKAGYEWTSILFEDSAMNYLLGIGFHTILGALIPIVLHILIPFIPSPWWAIVACAGLGWAVLEAKIVEVEKIERLVITLWNDPCAVVGAGRWWLPLHGFLFDCNPEHKTDVQTQETIIGPVKAMTTDKIQMTGTGIVNWKIKDSIAFMKINDAIMASNFKSAGTAELQETVRTNTKDRCIDANKELRNKILSGSTQLHEIAEQFGVEIVSCTMLITQSEESMKAEEKVAIEGYEAQVLKREQQEFMELKDKFVSSGMSAFEASQMALAVMGKGSSYNFIGSAGDFTKGAAIK